MNIKVADYTPFGGKLVEYDADAPCWMCVQPVVSASMGGTVICSWCDCGVHRDGTPWTIEDLQEATRRYHEARNLHLTSVEADPVNDENSGRGSGE
jgi:hypothetical protein